MVEWSESRTVQRAGLLEVKDGWNLSRDCGVRSTRGRAIESRFWTGDVHSECRLLAHSFAGSPQCGVVHRRNGQRT